MGCLPYLKFYPESWLSDIKVRRLTPEARCVYWDLLAMAWKEDGIPADMAELAQTVEWLGVKPKRFADRVWPQIEQFWVPGVNGRLVNPRQEKERTEAMEVYEKRRAAGRKGGRPKADGKP